MLWLALCVGLVAPQEGRSSEELFSAWKGLSEGDRQDCVDWFLAECDRSSQFRDTLERFVIRGYEGDPYDWPDAEEIAVFDPAVHAPAQVIPRKFVDEESRKWKQQRDRLVGAWVDREFRAAFRYDWGRGTVVKLGAFDDPERLAWNASLGYSPYTDLVEALVERTLDDGAMRDEAIAFGHAYADRSGNAFRTVSLYDAWSSGSTIEMPDVECLGIVHMLDDDWRTWRAPVPARKQNALYEHIGEHFSRLRRHRGLRTSLARAYVHGDGLLPSGWETAIVRLNGFWELHASDPAKLAEDLPSDKQWTRWLTKRGNEVDRKKEIVLKSRARRDALLASKAWSRRTFEGILTEYGAFDPPEPKPEPEASGDGGGDGGVLAPRAHARTP